MFAFLTYISFEKSLSEVKIKENKTQNKILIFQGLGGEGTFFISSRGGGDLLYATATVFP